MAFGLLFASSYFSVITPQGGSQNIIFAASGYLTQRELYQLGLYHHARLPGGVPADRVAVGVLRHERTMTRPHEVGKTPCMVSRRRPLTGLRADD